MVKVMLVFETKDWDKTTKDLFTKFIAKIKDTIIDNEIEVHRSFGTLTGKLDLEAYAEK